jgi:hypothetical protein
MFRDLRGAARAAVLRRESIRSPSSSPGALPLAPRPTMVSILQPERRVYPKIFFGHMRFPQLPSHLRYLIDDRS